MTDHSATHNGETEDEEDQGMVENKQSDTIALGSEDDNVSDAKMGGDDDNSLQTENNRKRKVSTQFCVLELW